MEGQTGEELGRGGRPAKFYLNFLTSDLGVMEGTQEAPLRGDGLREGGWR